MGPFSLFVYGSEHRQTALPTSDVDLLLICASADFTAARGAVIAALSTLHPEWKARGLDLKHCELTADPQQKAALVSITCELFEVPRAPLLGEDLLHRLHRPDWGQFVESVHAQRVYWYEQLLSRSNEAVLAEIKTDRRLKPLYNTVYAFALFDELRAHENTFIFDPGLVTVPVFKALRRVVRDQLHYRWPEADVPEALVLDALEYCRAQVALSAK